METSENTYIDTADNTPQVLTLEQSLQAYRVMNQTTSQTWKRHWADEKFSSEDYTLLSQEEKESFRRRLRECAVTICPNIRATAGEARTLEDLVDKLMDPARQSIAKTSREVIYSTADGARPVGSKAFSLWNGFQVIDMDIKDRHMAWKLKSVIFNRLCKCNWFLGVTLSASQKGLHVYTKITVPEALDDNVQGRKQMYLVNFRHKYSYVYLAALSAAESLGFTKDDLLKWMDLAMFRPQQGAFIGYDSHPLISTGFFEDFIYVNFDTESPVDWVTYPDLREVFKRWEWFEDREEGSLDIQVEDDGGEGMDIQNKVHYKHYERWRLANTLVKIYGLERGYKYLRAICSNTIKDKELQADCITAKRHEKPIDEWAVNRLNSVHGFKIKLNIQDSGVDESSIMQAASRVDNPTIIGRATQTITFHIKRNQYLGDIQGDIMKSLGRVTLLEAGAGLGKTEMVKMFAAQGRKVMMVMPFTSTIKSKVENDPNWYFSYGPRRPRLDVERGLALTLDKFARLQAQDIKIAGFDCVFIDESHLLFLSEYRPVMTKVIELVRALEMPVVLMSGTPSGELAFFPDITHIKVIKDDIRKKSFSVCLVDEPCDVLWHMCRKMAADIMNGCRILFPTNAGTLYSRQVKAAITYFLQNDWACFDEVRLAYYKKSNVGEKFMDDVNFDKTVRDLQVLMCSSYLSVGVDILDKYDFRIYMNDLMLPQEIDQFANRLRSRDLHISMFVSKNDGEGNTRSLSRFRPLDFRLNDEEVMNVHSILRLCNAMIERNPTEYKYNSLISSIIHENTFIEYDDISNKYFLNEIAYKLVSFERKYRSYAQQLPVVISGMMAYGYETSARTMEGARPEGRESFKDLKNMVKLAYDDQLNLNTRYVEELLDLITEERLSIYREVLRGSFTIRKGDQWKEDLSAKVMTVKSIEVFEKVVPIAISLSKRYDVGDIRGIFEWCRSGNRGFNFAAIQRIKILSNMLFNDQNRRLDLPIKEYMESVYRWIGEKDARTREEIRKFNQGFAMEYARKESEGQVEITKSVLTLQGLLKAFERIFRCLCTVSRPDKKGLCKIEKVELLWRPKEDVDEAVDTGAGEEAFGLLEWLGLAHEAGGSESSEEEDEIEEVFFEQVDNKDAYE